ncbi:MAG: carboxypeptidase regulatory-like domain-containing protein [Acidobacteriota bacterium]|nr:MAG: carboxypeptidase regulatory-like domain-containing protein [Acidobacteriota bacterium]
MSLRGYVFAALSVAVLAFSAAGNSYAQTSRDGVWKQVAESSAMRESNDRKLFPELYKVFRLNAGALENVLRQAPLEDSRPSKEAMPNFEIPSPDGKFLRFRLVESPMLAPHVAAKFPSWKTYHVWGVDDPTMQGRLDWTDSGFHGYVLTSEGSFNIDPYRLNDRQNYIVFYKKHYPQTRENFSCEVEDAFEESERSVTKKSDESIFNSQPTAEFSHGSNVRTYRFAVATTFEYTNFFRLTGDSDAQAQARAFNAVVVSVNRINLVYRKELSVFLSLVSDTNLTYVTNPETPSNYQNNGSSADLNANQTNVNSVIGSANYDFGHLFQTANGGVAQLSSVCGTSKARGLSGLPNPQGDPFDVDYVAHEMGHQMGGNHTFNAAANCGSSPTAARREPGSAVTIMGYAGICSSTSNISRNSIDIFHFYNLNEMITFMGGTGGTCGTTATPNAIPVVASVPNRTIPFNTPFALTASATDADGDALTYNWEQNDPGASQSNYPGTTDDDDTSLVFRPGFRSYLPTASPTRYFPSMTYVLNNQNEAPITYSGTSAVGAVCAGTCITGEDLPSAARTMNFRVTVRDGKGGIADQATVITVVNTITPFKVTSPNTNVVFPGGSSHTVTWDVSSTNTAPINTANVKISFSSDGGQTFPTVLAESTPNDGSQSVTIPNVNTTTGRIKVEAVGNIFFDVSDVNFTVNTVASNGSVSGQVFSSGGSTLRNAVVTITNEQGYLQRVNTSSFGFYQFDDVPAGTYIVTVSSRLFRFNPQEINLSGNVTGLNFTGLE